jgi:hypothetical protein
MHAALESKIANGQEAATTTWGRRGEGMELAIYGLVIAYILTVLNLLD